MMLRTVYWWIISGLIITTICTSCSNRLQPITKLPSDKLRKDFDVLRATLEKTHPSLYWYTSKETFDSLWVVQRQRITDSMQVLDYALQVLAPITSMVRCGHTTLSLPPALVRITANQKKPSFPILAKLWNDTLLVTGNLDKENKFIKRGMLITEINGHSVAQIKDKIYRQLSADGYAHNFNQIRISGNFPLYLGRAIGTSDKYDLSLMDSIGTVLHYQIPAWIEKADTAKEKKPPAVTEKSGGRKERLLKVRNLRIDTASSTAFMYLESFGGNLRLQRFFKSSFRRINEARIKHLVVDIRNNGGGQVNLAADLATYLRKSPFRVADSAYATTRTFGAVKKHFSSAFFYGLALNLLTKRSGDTYHLQYWEKHSFHPKDKLFFSGDVYLITGGPTFSAASLFAHWLKGQHNVTLVGEETGGANHGNSGLLFAKVVLPNSKLRLRLPLFRLVQFEHPPKTGRGIQPDVYVGPTIPSVLQRNDLKMQRVKELIDVARKSKLQ